MYSIGTWWLWVGFTVFILALISIDLFLFGGKKSHRVTAREALTWTFIWVSCALIFNFLLWWYLSLNHGTVIANQKALEFLTGYLIEESLSIDNMFVFLMIFGYFAVPPEYQRRVLLLGVLGAIVMRFIMIFFGLWLVVKIHWILYLFGLFLVMTGIKMLFMTEKKDLGENSIVKWLQQHMRVTAQFHQDKFFIFQRGLWYVTPLFLVLVLVEGSDLVFALDSIPAILAVTQDPFIVFTSNIFAILGLRSLYFLLARMAERFHLLKYGIAIMLTFIGIKMLIVPWVKIPIGVVLSIVAAILFISAVLSFLMTAKDKNKI